MNSCKFFDNLLILIPGRTENIELFTPHIIGKYKMIDKDCCALSDKHLCVLTCPQKPTYPSYL